MKPLSCTQEYFLCAINSKISAPFFLYSVFPACLVVGGIIELLENGYIVSIGKGDLIACKTWDDGLPYLKPLFETIMTLRRISDEKGVVGVFMSILGNKRFEELYSTIGDSLVESQCADEMIKYGLNKKKIKYVPKAEAVKSVIDKVRTGFFMDGRLTEETLSLSALLDKSVLISSYFSKTETEIVRKRIEEVQKSEAYAFADTVLNFCDNKAVAAI